MVRVHHGKKEAFLRFSTSGVTPSIYVCAKDGSLLAKEYIGSVEEAYYWLAKRWRIPTMLVYDGADEFDYSQVDGDEQIISDEKKSGDLTPQEEAGWLMFNQGQVVYNLADGQFWVVDCKINYSHDRSIPVIPSHRRIFTSQWSVPRYPDERYSAFECDLKKAHPDAEVQIEDRLGHFKVARLMGSIYPRNIPVVTIQKDSSSNDYRIVNLSGERKTHVFFRSDEDGVEGWWRTIQELTQKHLEASWKSLFPKEWDVVAVSRREFYEHTFAGHCYQTENFVGVESIPQGYAIAWENRYDNMLLIRLGKDSTVRCPPEFKGKVIGTGGGNIKGIAKKLGRDHWRLKLV